MVDNRKQWKAWLYLSPAIVLLLVFTVWPIINTLIMAFQNGYSANAAKAGAEFAFGGAKGNGKDIAVVVLSRLVLVPLVFLMPAVWLGFSGESLACLLITFGGPIAVSSFSMSQQMGGDENLSAQTIIASSALCLVTLFLWIFALSSLHLF